MAQAACSFGSMLDGCAHPRIESLVLLAIHRRHYGVARARIHAELDDIDPDTVAESIASLAESGVVEVRGGYVYPSPQLNRLVALDMIGF